ncbi:virulence-associated protein E [Caproiciproducens galactitolivorans]|uniref:Virulence-associated protein E n=1 Tax=Caproiciproducens galactitolivorans TaxID=642589 RepID=A0A4Z0YEW4_9FIRM|nr:virulence-associated E family protein [Caproiciproducens galactitolivorans]QEY33719.1 virulence-associated protein E [Caproiciproducens galactitolivorans]TGJ75502.1 virulence-associated protein E [Caproiciproducens galactitolivorans]
MLQYDRQITISTGNSRNATRWPAQTLYLSDLYDKLRTPLRGTETLDVYLKMSKAQQDSLKDVGGFVGGIVHGGGRRKGNAIDGRDILTLDLDHIPAGGTNDVLRRVDGLGCGYAVYSTRKHSPDAPRLRIILPLDRTVTADEYEPIARMTANLIGIGMCDPSTFEASRLMYWPSCCCDSQYVFTYGDKPFLSADGMLALYPDWHDINAWPQVPGVQDTHKRLAAKQGDPTQKSGVVGAFCRTYNIYDVMEKFLPGIYEPVDNSSERYTYTGGSTTGGAIVYDNGTFLYSHHATDPAGGKLCNAFDLVRYHLFSDKDDDAKPDTPTNRLPSYTAMCELAVADAAVAALLNKERYENATKDFTNDSASAENETPEDWMKLLQVSPQTGVPAKTTDNILIILENDPLLKGRIQYDEFAKRGIVADTLPWDLSHPGRRTWNDNDDKGARWYMEKIYGITGKDKVTDALGLCGNNHSFNEVKDYLNSLQWDGVPRLDRLFIDYLGAADTEYVRAVTRKSFTAAVARALNPGCKYDTMPILTGPQGIGKSTLLNKMGRKWFTDGLKTFEGKEACELIQGVWIVEIGELEAFNKSEVGRIKQFLSQRVDRFRAAYGRHVQECPRCCVFFGTSNNGEYLRDPTGGRRFWPVDLAITQPTKSVFKDLDNELDQLWAEAVTRWKLGEPLYLSGELEKAAKEEQESHREHSTREGIIIDFLEQKVPEDWDSWDLQRRLMFWNGGEKNPELKLVERRKVCALEIWCEALGNDIRAIKNSDSAEINAIIAMRKDWKRMKSPGKFGYCKAQRGFEKVATN